MRMLIGIALPTLTILAFVVLLSFSLLRLSDIERSMRIEAPQNMLWVLSRAHVASLQLDHVVARLALEDSDPAELALRHNVFLSRLALLGEGPQQRAMEALGLADALAQFRQHLPELQARIGTLQPHDAQGARAIRVLLEPLQVLLGQASNRAMVAEWNDLGDRLDTSRHQVWQIIVSLIGISLAGITLIFHFIMATRAAHQRTRQLDQEKAFSELLIDSSGEGIVVVDLDRRCTVWNEAAERLFQQPADAAIGRPLEHISGFFQIDPMKYAIDEALFGQAATLFDQPFFPDGAAAAQYVEVRCFPLRDGERIMGAILLVFDVTERRAAQREIAMHRDHLEQLVHDRTRELDAALERERATAELYRNFGAMISHQFRTPLAIVDSALQRLMRRSEILTAAEVRERGGKARQAIARLIGLVESTLDAARLDSGQIESRGQPCDLAELAADACARQREATPGRQILLMLPDSGDALAQCDPAHVEQILANLLANAAKYSTPGTPISVTVRTDRGAVVCTVTNQGHLASATERAALFERYFRGGNAEGHAGIGIGLYMARTLARLQGGDVQLIDGTTGMVSFALQLPRPPSSAVAASAAV